MKQNNIIIFSIVFGILLASINTSQAQINPIQVNVNNDGSYNVYLNGKLWLQSGITGFNMYQQLMTSENNLLTLARIIQTQGMDNNGQYNSTVLNWQNTNSQVFYFIGEIRTYLTIPLVSFVATYPNGLPNTWTGNQDETTTMFPSFKVAQLESFPQRGFVNFGGFFIGEGGYDQWVESNDSSKPTNITGGLQYTGPIALFTQDLEHTTVISPASQFFAVNQFYNTTSSELYYGVFGNATGIPTAFSYEVQLYYGNQGINHALKSWGDQLANKYNKQNPEDFTSTHLGYWTDNGGYYYYLTEPNKTYEQTMIDVNNYANSLEIPYTFYQFDSWFYYKGKYDGVTNWTGIESYFPNGLEGMYQELGAKPIIAHNRWWSYDNVYAKQNGGDYDFNIDQFVALPLEQQFWDYLFKEGRKWGLRIYEQDWLNIQTLGSQILTTDVNAGRNWLLQMGQAAANNFIKIMYCMPWTRHVLQSIEIPAVVSTRVSMDYQPGNYQWKIGISSMIAYALRLFPFKDNFWTTEYQTGNPYNLSEPAANLEAAIATFSAGSVSISDKINSSNATLIMRSCMTDGTLIQPSKPATAIDELIVERAFQTGSGPTGELYSTFSNINGVFRWDHVIAADIRSSFELKPSHVNKLYSQTYNQLSQSQVIFEHIFEDSIEKIITQRQLQTSSNIIAINFTNDDMSITIPSCGKADFKLYHTAPVFLERYAILGELSKWVTMSPNRVDQINIQLLGQSLEIILKGVPSEQVVFTFLDYVNPIIGAQRIDITCILGPNGRAKIQLPQNTCY